MKKICGCVLYSDLKCLVVKLSLTLWITLTVLTSRRGEPLCHFSNLKSACSDDLVCEQQSLEVLILYYVLVFLLVIKMCLVNRYTKTKSSPKIGKLNILLYVRNISNIITSILKPFGQSRPPLSMYVTITNQQ